MDNYSFTSEQIKKLKDANHRLLINTDCNEGRNGNLIFVYCPPKVGSTSLVSSIRLFANEYYNVLHLHNEEILRALYGIEVSINEIIKFNSLLGKKIIVFDVYRNPIEHKISIFFEKLTTLHFSAPLEIVGRYPIEKIIRRFNNIFPYLGANDYFKNEYNIEIPEHFDFENKFLSVTKENVRYVKLRLADSEKLWSKILKEILGKDIRIIRDYETTNKAVSEIYNRFQENYKIGENLLELVKSDKGFSYYQTEEEKDDYISKWGKKTEGVVRYFTENEYKLYINIVSDNQYMGEIQANHYKDNGCICNGCNEKRKNVREGKLDKVIHKADIEDKKGIRGQKISNFFKMRLY
jgi:hypothetical protein